MAKQLNEDLSASLLDAIRGDGEIKYFSQEEINKTAERYSKFAEENEMKERLRKALTCQIFCVIDNIYSFFIITHIFIIIYRKNKVRKL